VLSSDFKDVVERLGDRLIPSLWNVSNHWLKDIKPNFMHGTCHQVEMENDKTTWSISYDKIRCGG
jgi:hypothetical protein